jgi:CheY-like chemotaxis protein
MEAVGRLAGGVAHDFNNLLMVIASYAEAMRLHLRPEDPLHRNVDQVEKAVDKGASLTQQLLAFSHKQVLSPRIIDLNSVVEDGVKMITRLIGEDIELSVLPSRELWLVKADPGQIFQVLMNLCVNARDAMRGGGSLTISTQNASFDLGATKLPHGIIPGNYAALVVSDSGAGMTKDVLAHIFDPFFTTKEPGRGTGLGLSMVHGIVEQSGGHILVDSEPGHGTTFALYFPAVEGPPEAAFEAPLDAVEGKGETVLLAEDEDALRESISEYLTMHGYNVLAASDGVEALRIAKEHSESIQLLITDVILPKLSGAGVAREVGRMTPRTAILYISGYTDRELDDGGAGGSAVDFLQKPFALRALLNKIGELLGRRG